MTPEVDLPQRLKPGRFDRFGLDRLERELREMLNTICAYRDAIGDYGLVGGRADASANDAAHPPQRNDDILVPSRDLPPPSALPEHATEGPLGDTGWVLLGDGWLLRAPDGYRLRLNICERALLLALANAKDHAISFDAFFQLMGTTRAVYGQKPLAVTSKRMILMRLMKKLACSTSPGPLMSVYGWGYRLRAKDELLPQPEPSNPILGRAPLRQPHRERLMAGDGSAAR